MSSKKKSILAVIVVISLLLIILAGYTFSKYFSSVTGNATAEIAAWSFKANAGKENSTLSDIKLVPTNGSKIAPGTSGEFQIKVDSIGSDVDVNYRIQISQEKLPANMKFNLKGETQTFTTMAALANSKLTGTLDSTNNQQKTYTIQWNWPYTTLDSENNTLVDSKDMEALEIPANELGFKIEVIGEEKQ